YRIGAGILAILLLLPAFAGRNPQRPNPAANQPTVQPLNRPPTLSTRDLAGLKTILLSKIGVATTVTAPAPSSGFRLPFSGAANAPGAPGANAAAFRVDNQAPPANIVFTAG